MWNVDLRGDRSLTLRYVPHNRVPLDKGRREVLKHVHRLWGSMLLEQQNADGSIELLTAARRGRTRYSIAGRVITKGPLAPCSVYRSRKARLTHIHG